jgi:hypothetical protein
MDCRRLPAMCGQNREIVADGRTGFLISAPSLRHFTQGYVIHFEVATGDSI